MIDIPFDFMLKMPRAAKALEDAVRACPTRRILVVGVEVPGREGDMETVRQILSSNKHVCDYSFVAMKPKGKFDNVNDALEIAGEKLQSADWLIITEDDIGASDKFLDNFIALIELGGLDLAQPAHRMRSYTSWSLTKRVWRSLVRRTNYVEIGPLTAINRRVFDELIPFPSMRWAWGLDAYWAHLAALKNWKLGIVDGTPIEHLRPVGGIYAREEAEREGDIFLKQNNVTIERKEAFAPGHILVGW